LRATLADQRGEVGRSLDHVDAARAKLKTAASQLVAAGFLAQPASWLQFGVTSRPRSCRSDG